MALARGAVLYPGRKVSSRDLRGDRRSLAPASDRLSDLLAGAELFSVSHRPRCDERVRTDNDGRGGKDDRPVGGATGESPPRGGGDGGLGTGTGRRDGGRRLPVRPGRLR